MKLRVASVFLAACGLGSGCAGRTGAGSFDGGIDGATGTALSDGGSGPTLNISNLGGTILVRAMPEGFAASIEIYSSVTPADLPPLTLGDGHCDIASPWTADPISAVDLDLGATVTIISGTRSATATLDSAPVDPTRRFSYVAGVADPDPPYGSTWTVSNSGSPTGLAAETLASVTLPGAIDLGNTDSFAFLSQIVPGSPATATFSGGAGADSIHLHLLGGDGLSVADCYPAPNTTSFVIPGAVTAAVGANPVVGLWAEKVSVVEIASEQVLVKGITDNFD